MFYQYLQATHNSSIKYNYQMYAIKNKNKNALYKIFKTYVFLSSKPNVKSYVITYYLNFI